MRFRGLAAGPRLAKARGASAWCGGVNSKGRAMQSEVKPRMYKVLIPLPKSNGQGTYWMRVGTAFPTKDGSGALNVLVDALPAAPGPKMMFHVREMDEEDFQRGGEGG